MLNTTAPAAIRAEREQRSETGFIPLCVPHLAIAARLGVPHAVATVNGTAALHVALLACNVMPDDEVLVPTLTFIAPANAVRYCGAWPVFIDADPVTWQMDIV